MDEDFGVNESLTGPGNVEEGGVDPGGGFDDAPGDSAELLDDSGSTESLDAPATPAANPIEQRFTEMQERYEQRLAQLEASLKRNAEERHAPRAVIPDALTKPQSEWTPKDLQEYNQYIIDQRLQVITQENTYRGILNASALGEGNDYDSVVNKYLYENTQIQSDPTSLNFVRGLNPVSKYILGLVHEVYAKAGNDPVKAIKAIRNALSARVQGAKDIQQAVTSKARQTNLGIIRGGKPSGQTNQSKDYWDEDEKAFAHRVRRNS